MVEERFADKSIPASPFAGDDGARVPDVDRLWPDWARGQDVRLQLLTALATSRVFVPVVAVLDTVEIDEAQRAREKDSHMATVSVSGADGSRRSLVFTSTTELQAWNPDARPVPVFFSQACEAAVADGAKGIIVDVSTVRPLVVEANEVDLGAVGRLGLALFAQTRGPKLIEESLAEPARIFDVSFELVAATSPTHLARLVIVGPEDNVRAAAQVVAAALADNQELAAMAAAGLEIGGRATT